MATSALTYPSFKIMDTTISAVINLAPTIVACLYRWTLPAKQRANGKMLFLIYSLTAAVTSTCFIKFSEWLTDVTVLMLFGSDNAHLLYLYKGAWRKGSSDAFDYHAKLALLDELPGG